MIESWTMERNELEIFYILGEAAVPCASALTAEDTDDNPHLAARGMIMPVEHPSARTSHDAQLSGQAVRPIRRRASGAT